MAKADAPGQDEPSCYSDFRMSAAFASKIGCHPGASRESQSSCAQPMFLPCSVVGA